MTKMQPFDITSSAWSIAVRVFDPWLLLVACKRPTYLQIFTDNEHHGCSRRVAHLYGYTVSANPEVLEDIVVFWRAVEAVCSSGWSGRTLRFQYSLLTLSHLFFRNIGRFWAIAATESLKWQFEKFESIVRFYFKNPSDWFTFQIRVHFKTG